MHQRTLGDTIRLPLSGKGATFSLGEAKTLLAKDSKDRVVFAASTPTMWDATADEHTGEHIRQAQVGIDLENTDGQQTLVLTPDRALLTDPAAQFPITIDPGVTLARATWTYVDRGFPDTSYYKTTDDLKVGTYNAAGNLLRSMVGFNLGVVASTDVLSATFNSRLVYSWSCTATQVQLYPLADGASFGSGATWNKQPAVGPIAASNTVAGGYSSACPAKAVGFNITDEVAAAGRQPRLHVVAAARVQRVQHRDREHVLEEVGTAQGSVDSLPVRIRPRWKDQHRAHALPPGVRARRDRGRPSG
jgi:hypothetical protein